MARTARIEPVTEEHEDGTRISGWKVVDISDPDNETEVSRHATEPEALKAARAYEGYPEYTLRDQEGEGEQEQTFAVRQVDAPADSSGTRFELYNAATGASHGYFDSEHEAREAQARLQASKGNADG